MKTEKTQKENEVKHTPGPWRIGNLDCVVADVPTTERNGTGHSDTEYYGGYLVCESLSPANARLIAAAPAMNVALRLITLGLARIERSRHVSDLEEFCFEGIRYCLNGDWNNLISIIGWGKCRAAIQKAESNSKSDCSF